MNLIVLTPPPVEPVTLEDVYGFLRMDPDGSPPTHPDDAMLVTMIASAREKIEDTTRRALVQQTVRMVLPGFPRYQVRDGLGLYDDDFAFTRDAGVDLLRPPFREIVAVRYYDENNALQTLAADQYFVSEGTYLARLEVVDGASWPATMRRGDALQIEYVAGYAPDGSPPTDYRANLPASLVDAVKFEVQLQYDELAPEKRKDIQDTIARLVRSFIVPKF